MRSQIVMELFIDLNEHIRKEEKKKLNELSNHLEKWQNDIKINPNNTEKGNKSDRRN